MKVYKFGDCAVDSPSGIAKISEILQNNSEQAKIVVVAASASDTDALLECAELASIKDSEFEIKFEAVKQRHISFIESVVLEESKRDDLLKFANSSFSSMSMILKGIELIGELTAKTLDRVGSIGDEIYAKLVSVTLDAEFVSGSEIIKTDSNYGDATVLFKETNSLIVDRFKSLNSTIVVSGFVASNSDGVTTTLGRGGSDYTASIIAAALNASILEIYTPYDGFMSADPEVIDKAYSIPSLTYNEALELSHFGAGVIYPPSILPVYQKGIPIKVKRIDLGEGTLISNGNSVEDSELPIKGISSMSNISMITLSGLGMVGVVGVASRLFSALGRANINVILISQASSENTISVAVIEANEELAYQALHDEFSSEIESGQISEVARREDLSVVAVVGESMKHSAGIAGKLFQTLGRNGISAISIAQGSFEQNISWVVESSDLKKSLSVIHESFFLSPYVELNLFLVGLGTVGNDLLKQIEQQQDKLMSEHRLKIRITGMANSRKMIFDREGIEPGGAVDELMSKGESADLSKFVETIGSMNLFNSVFVDCTAHDTVAAVYEDVLKSYVSIVAANKVAASSEYSRYSNLKSLAQRKGVKFLFETNVGAGLPLISTINDLKRSGDTILKIEAVLSGTLNFLFNTLSSDIPFSRAIMMAKEEGFSEPDPRIDLSGVDVLRKVVILARESGYSLEQRDVTTEPFIPTSLFSGSEDEFWDALPSLDAEFELKRQKLESEGKKWRYVGKFEDGKGSCSLQVVDSMHPFYDLEGSNNIVLLTTERYQEYPMQIKGYGAGAAVTAAGVFADIIKIANI